LIPDVTHAVDFLKHGKLVAFPTETVYGLGADATTAAAVEKIFAVKGRPLTNPLICHVADEDVAKRYVTTWPHTAQALVERFWPGPLTIVLPKTDAIIPEVTAGLGTVGLRAPDHPLTLAMLREFDGPVAGPSANRSTHVSPTTAQHVRDELGDAVDLILDGGACTVGIESTVLDLSSEQPRILRPGGLSRAAIEEVIGPVQIGHMVAEATTPAVAPGQHAKHYAPRTPSFRFEPAQREQVSERTATGWPSALVQIGSTDLLQKTGALISMPQTPENYARYLYHVLRELDELDVAAIFIEMPPDEPAWLALRDRINRATKPLDEFR
jgi:L-threonylcarbamoyladenylate synthase